MAKNDKPFDVGYQRPPKSGQFVKGQSGNPKGRPRGTQNVVTLAFKIFRERIRVNISGRQKTMTKLEAIVLQLVNRALSGDSRALKDVLYLQSLCERSEHVNDTLETAPDERDKDVMESLFKRVQQADVRGDLAISDKPMKSLDGAK
jgi:hypothetical protein